MIAFALSRSFLLSLLLLAASGAVDNVSVVLRATLLQTLTPEHMLGRASSVNQVFIGSSNEIGAFESGVGGPAPGPGALGGLRGLHDPAGGGDDGPGRCPGSGGWTASGDIDQM